MLGERVQAPVRLPIGDGDEDVRTDDGLHAVILDNEIRRRRAASCGSFEVGKEAPSRASEPQSPSSLFRGLPLLGPHRSIIPEHVRQGLGVLDAADEGVHVVGVLAADEADSRPLSCEEVLRGDADIRAELT